MGHSVSSIKDIKDSVTEDINFEEFVKQIEFKMHQLDGHKINNALEILDKKVFQNPDSRKANFVRETVESFVEVVLINLKRLNPRWDFKMVKSGSFYEGLRVGLPYEFDFMLEFTNINTSSLVIEKGLPNGYNVYYDNQDMYFKPSEDFARKGEASAFSFSSNSQTPLSSFHFCDEENSGKISYEKQFEILSYYLRYALYTDLNKVVTQIMEHRGLKVLVVKQIKDFNPNFCVWLELDGVGVMLDLVPCLPFPEQFFGILPELNRCALDLFDRIMPQIKAKEDIVRFVSKNLYLACFQSKWRVSYSVLETTVMNNIDSALKRPLRILKYFTSTMFIHPKSAADLVCESTTEYNCIKTTEAGLELFGYKTYFKSYPIKCIFLDLISDIYSDNKVDAYRANPWHLLLSMLHKLIWMPIHSQRYLVLNNKGMFFGNYNFSFTKVSDTEGQEFLDRICDMLMEANRCGHLGMFPMLNYPKAEGAVLIVI